MTSRQLGVGDVALIASILIALGALGGGCCIHFGMRRQKANQPQVESEKQRKFGGAWRGAARSLSVG